MKFQLVILSALLVSAIALPVPDEEVSPVVEPLAEIKPDVAHKVEEKITEVIKPELRNIDEVKSLPTPLTKPIEEIKLELPASAPDAELLQTLPELKKEEIIKEKEILKEEIKEDKKPELLAEKQIRSDDVVVEETKALPVVVAPVSAAGLSEEPKQVVDEIKPAVQEILPEGKSASAEDKKDEILAIETKPEIKPEELKPELLAEEKKEELPARQERTTLEQAEEKVEINLAAVPDVAPAETIALPAVKGLLAEETQTAEEIKPEATSETKILEQPEKIEEPLALASEEKPKEELKPVEAKKIDEILPELIKPAEAPVAAEIKAAKPEEAEKQTLQKPIELKSSEEQKSNESKKADESKESEESKESKESDESKEDNKSN